MLKPAITHLEKSVILDNSNSAAWRLLATAYGRDNNMPMSYLALAEEALLKNNSKNALQMANQAMASLKESSPAYRRAQDIKNQAMEMKKHQEQESSPF